jgi:hypothetical protein
VVGSGRRDVRLRFPAGPAAPYPFRASLVQPQDRAAFRRIQSGDQRTHRGLRRGGDPPIQPAGGGDRLRSACGDGERLLGPRPGHGIQRRVGRVPRRRGHGGSDAARRERADPGNGALHAGTRRSSAATGRRSHAATTDRISPKTATTRNWPPPTRAFPGEDCRISTRAPCSCC